MVEDWYLRDPVRVEPSNTRGLRGNSQLSQPTEIDAWLGRERGPETARTETRGRLVKGPVQFKFYE